MSEDARSDPPPGDPRRYPERPWVGVGVVVWRDGRVLLIRRGRAPRAGEWGIPGGAQEIGETLFETATREVLEETGLVIRPVCVVTALDGIVRDESGRPEFHYTLVEISAEWESGEAIAQSDVAEVRWVAPDQVGNFVKWDETARVVSLAASMRSG